jgi:hypothetical protein
MSYPEQAPSVTSVAVSGPTSIEPGERASYAATARYSDGSSQDVTALAMWTAPVGSAIRLTTAGVVLGIRPGEGLLTAFHEKAGSIRVFVLARGTFKLSGLVSDSSGRVLDGVTVEVLSGTGQGLQATTDGRGHYALYGVAGPVRLRASADGFTTQVHEVVVAANDSTDSFALTPAAETADVSGVWTMTVAPSPDCRPGFPKISQGRTYQLQVTQQGTGLQMKISSPTLQVFNDQFHGSVVGTRVRLIFPGDTYYGEWSTPDLYDHLSPTEKFGFNGTVEGNVTGAEIRGRMNGDLVFWNAPTFDPAWYCRANDHIVTIQR